MSSKNDMTCRISLRKGIIPTNVDGAFSNIYIYIYTGEKTKRHIECCYVTSVFVQWYLPLAFRSIFVNMYKLFMLAIISFCFGIGVESKIGIFFFLSGVDDKSYLFFHI